PSSVETSAVTPRSVSVSIGTGARSTATTADPSTSRRSTTARPIPDAPPVTITTLPARPASGIAGLWSGLGGPSERSRDDQGDLPLQVPVRPREGGRAALVAERARRPRAEELGDAALRPEPLRRRRRRGACAGGHGLRRLRRGVVRRSRGLRTHPVEPRVEGARGRRAERARHDDA